MKLKGNYFEIVSIGKPGTFPGDTGPVAKQALTVIAHGPLEVMTYASNVDRIKTLGLVKGDCISGVFNTPINEKTGKPRSLSITLR